MGRGIFRRLFCFNRVRLTPAQVYTENTVKAPARPPRRGGLQEARAPRAHGGSSPALSFVTDSRAAVPGGGRVTRPLP